MIGELSLLFMNEKNLTGRTLIVMGNDRKAWEITCEN